MEVCAGTALGEAEEVRWDTTQLQRGNILLMVATSRHHRMPALPESKDALQGALFNLWTPDPSQFSFCVMLCCVVSFLFLFCVFFLCHFVQHSSFFFVVLCCVVLCCVVLCCVV